MLFAGWSISRVVYIHPKQTFCFINSVITFLFIYLFIYCFELFQLLTVGVEVMLHLITLSDTHTHTHTHCRTPLEDGSDRLRDVYLTKHNTHKRQISIHQAGFETAFAGSECPQTNTLDRVATEIGNLSSKSTIFTSSAFK